jgi:hypothetical protein
MKPASGDGVVCVPVVAAMPGLSATLQLHCRTVKLEVPELAGPGLRRIRRVVKAQNLRAGIDVGQAHLHEIVLRESARRGRRDREHLGRRQDALLHDGGVVGAEVGIGRGIGRVHLKDRAHRDVDMQVGRRRRRRAGKPRHYRAGAQDRGVLIGRVDHRELVGVQDVRRLRQRLVVDHHSMHRGVLQ